MDRDDGSVLWAVAAEAEAAGEAKGADAEEKSWELPGLNRHLQHRRWQLTEEPSVSSFLGRGDEQASGSRPAQAVAL